MDSVGERSGEQTHDGVEEYEHKAGEEAELGIGELEIGDDEVGEAGDQLPVDEVHDVEHGEEEQQAVIAQWDGTIERGVWSAGRIFGHDFPPDWWGYYIAAIALYATWGALPPRAQYRGDKGVIYFGFLL